MMSLTRALTESEWTYDQKFKQLFQNKKFLVPILKNVVKEYKDLELTDIEELINLTGQLQNWTVRLI